MFKLREIKKLCMGSKVYTPENTVSQKQKEIMQITILHLDILLGLTCDLKEVDQPSVHYAFSKIWQRDLYRVRALLATQRFFALPYRTEADFMNVLV